MKLCAEIHRWAPAVLNKSLEGSLREAQLKEVAEASQAASACGKPLVPTVQLRRDRQRASTSGPIGGGGGSADAPPAFDASDLLQEVDLGKVLKKTDYASLKTSKVCANKHFRCFCRGCCLGVPLRMLLTRLLCPCFFGMFLTEMERT